MDRKLVIWCARSSYAAALLSAVAVNAIGSLHGAACLSVWRIPEHKRALPFDSEDFVLDVDGSESSHGVSVRACPPPGPRAMRATDAAGSES